jgi:hypothetical protein
MRKLLPVDAPLILRSKIMVHLDKQQGDRYHMPKWLQDIIDLLIQENLVPNHLYNEYLSAHEQYMCDNWKSLLKACHGNTGHPGFAAVLNWNPKNEAIKLQKDQVMSGPERDELVGYYTKYGHSKHYLAQLIDKGCISKSQLQNLWTIVLAKKHSSDKRTLFLKMLKSAALDVQDKRVQLTMLYTYAYENRNNDAGVDVVVNLIDNGLLEEDMIYKRLDDIALSIKSISSTT